MLLPLGFQAFQGGKYISGEVINVDGGDKIPLLNNHFLGLDLLTDR
jgi:hypothetical protein